MNEERKKRAIERGTDLLTPFGAEIGQVARLELATEKFRNPATAKQWARNHGLPIGKVTTSVKHVHVACRDEDDFEAGTLRREQVTKTAWAWIGVLKGHLVDPEDEKPIEETPTDPEKPVEKRSVRLRGDLFVIAKQEDDPEDSVRTIGIVAKPEDPDAEGTVISVEEIERANFGFMKDFGTVGFMHQTDVSEKVKIIQNAIAPIEFTWPGTDRVLKAGTWYQEHYTADPELVKRIRNGDITGLSLGGLAQVEEFDEPVEMAVSKNAKTEETRVAKGDVATNRFHNLRVEEVSLVDAAANEEDFLVIKRRKEMKTNEAADVKKNEAAATPETPKPAETPAAPVAKTEAEPETVATTEPEAPAADPSIAEQVAAGVAEGIKQGLAGVQPVTQSAAPAATPAPAPVSKSKDDEILEAIAGINRRLDEQDAKIEKATNVRAAAKGASVPDSTTTAKSEGGEEKPKSKWAGTAVHRVAQRGRS